MIKKILNLKACCGLICCLMIVVSICGALLSSPNSAYAEGAIPKNDIRFIYVDGGLNHTVALTASGDVYGWGSNAHNQLGLGQAVTNVTNPRLLVTSSELVDLMDGNEYNKDDNNNDRIIKVACMENTTALLMQSGEVFFTGDNHFGQFGDGGGNNANIVADVGYALPSNTTDQARPNKQYRWIRYRGGIVPTTQNTLYFSDIYAGAQNLVMKIDRNKGGTFIAHSGTVNISEIQTDLFITTGPRSFLMGNETGLTLTGGYTNSITGYFGNAIQTNYNYNTHEMLKLDFDTPDSNNTTTVNNISNYVYQPYEVFQMSGANLAISPFINTSITDLAVGGNTMYFTHNSDATNIYAKGKNFLILDTGSGAAGIHNTLGIKASDDNKFSISDFDPMSDAKLSMVGKVRDDTVSDLSTAEVQSLNTVTAILRSPKSDTTIKNETNANVENGSIQNKRIFASNSFAYAITGDNTFIGWGNNTKGQINPLETTTRLYAPGATTANGIINNVHQVTLSGNIVTLAAGKTKSVKHVAPTSGDLPSASYRSAADIANDEGNAEFISAALTEDGKVTVWGNNNSIGKIKPENGRFELKIEGDAKISAVFPGYNMLYLISEYGKLYVYDGSVEDDGVTPGENTPLRAHNKFYTFSTTRNQDNATDIIQDLTITNTKRLSFNGVADNTYASVNLRKGIKKYEKGVLTQDNDAFVSSFYRNALRILPPVATLDNGGTTAVGNWLSANLGEYNSPLRTSALAFDSTRVQISDARFKHSEAVKFEMVNSATGVVNEAYGDDGDITGIISKYLAYNFTFDGTEAISSTHTGYDVSINIKPLMRTPSGHEIRMTIPFAVYDGYTKEAQDNIFETGTFSLAITTANTEATLFTAEANSAIADGLIEAIVDANDTSRKVYSYAIMDVDRGVTALLNHLGVSNPTTNYGEFIAQAKAKDEGFNRTSFGGKIYEKYNWLAFDLDADLVYLNESVFSGGKLIATLNSGVSNFDVTKKLITIELTSLTSTAYADQDALEKALELFKNYYGLRDITVTLTNNQISSLSFKYEIMQVTAIKSTTNSEGTQNERVEFFPQLNEYQSSSQSIGHPLKNDSVNRSLLATVDSTIYFKESAFNVANPKVSITLEYMKSTSIRLESFFTDNALIGFYAAELDATKFNSGFDSQVVTVNLLQGGGIENGTFNSGSIQIKALTDKGKVTLTVAVRRGFRTADTFTDWQTPVELTVEVVFLPISNPAEKFNRKTVSNSDLTILHSTTGADITTYFSGMTFEGIPGGALHFISVNSSNTSILEVSIDSTSRKLNFVPKGAGNVRVVMTVGEFDRRLTETYTFTVIGTATYNPVLSTGDNLYYINGKRHMSINNLKQYLISINSSLKTNSILTYMGVEYYDASVQPEALLETEVAERYIKITVPTNSQYVYFEAGSIFKGSNNRFNVVYIFRDESGIEYRLRHRLGINQFTFEPNAENPDHSPFFMTVSGDTTEFTITITDILTNALSSFHQASISQYKIEFVFVDRVVDSDIADRVVANFSTTTDRVTVIPEQNGEQIMGALVSFENRESYSIYFRIYVDGISMTLSAEDYRAVFIVSCVVMTIVFIVIYMIRMSFYWRKVAEQRRIVKKNRELIKLRESMHSKSGVSKQTLVKTKLKMEDPKYAKMFNEVKREKMEEAGVTVGEIAENAKGKKKNKKSIDEIKAELEKKKAQFAEMQMADALMDMANPTDMDGNDIVFNNIDFDQSNDIPMFEGESMDDAEDDGKKKKKRK